MGNIPQGPRKSISDHGATENLLEAMTSETKPQGGLVNELNMGRRVERQARENSVPWRKCEVQESGRVHWGRMKARDEGGGVGKLFHA